MKRIIQTLATVIGLCLSTSASAQTDASFLVPNPQTARWSYVLTDETGKHVATEYHSIASLDGDGINGKMKIRVKEVSTSSPSDTLESFIYFSCKNGEYMADMTAFFEEEIIGMANTRIAEEVTELTEEERQEAMEKIRSELKVSGEMRGIPRYPTVGQLPDYSFQFKLSIFNLKVSGEKRKIVGTEKIVTDAGTFDCFILEETRVTKVMMMKEVEKVKTWYAYGIGTVKEISYDKSGKLLSTTLLNGINW